MAMYDEIKVLKNGDQTEIDVDMLKYKEKERFNDDGYDDQDKFDNRPDRTALNVGLLLITIGIVALLLMQNNNLWHYWWVIFFFKPFFFGFWGHGKCHTS